MSDDDAPCSRTNFTGDLETAFLVLTVTWVLIMAYAGVLLVLFVKRRKLQPLKARPFRTTILSLVLMMVWATEICFQYIHRENHSCFIFLALSWPMLVISLNIYMSRVWLLWFKFKSTEGKSTLPPLSIPRLKVPKALKAVTATIGKSDGKRSRNNMNIIPTATRDQVNEVVDSPKGSRGPLLGSSAASCATPSAIVSNPYSGTGLDGGYGANTETSSRLPALQKIEMSEGAQLSSTHGHVVPIATPKSFTLSIDTSQGESPRSPYIQMRKSLIFDDDAPLPTSTPRSISLATYPQSDADTNAVSRSDKQASYNWYLAHKHWGTDRFMLRVFGVKTALEWLLLMSPTATSNGRVFSETLIGRCWCPSIYFPLVAFQVILAYHCIIFVYAAYRFTKVSDGFYLKTEFKLISVVCIIGTPVWNVFAQFDTDFPYSAYTLVVMTFGVFTITSAYPLSKTRNAGMRTKLSSQSHSASIPASQLSSAPTKRGGYSQANSALYTLLMDTEHGMEEFSEHLKREFSLENLLFWQAVEQYRSEFDELKPDANLELARALDQRYIDDTSALQVNLSSSDYKLIRSQLASGSITADLFDKSQHHIFRLMATDSFVRFENQRQKGA